MTFADLRATAMIDVATAIYPPISKAMFLGRQRTAKLAARRPAALRLAARRHAVMWLLYHRGLSSPQIGAALHRHHATVLYGRDQVDALLGPADADALRAMPDVWAIKWVEAKLCR